MNIHTARSNRSMSCASEHVPLSTGYLYYDNDKWSYCNRCIGLTGYTIDLTQLYIDIQTWILNQVELYKLNGGEISIYSINREHIILLWSNRFISIKLKLARPDFIPLFIVNSNNQSYHTYVTDNYRYPEDIQIDYRSYPYFTIQKYIKIYFTSISNQIGNHRLKFVNACNECCFSFYFIQDNSTLFKFELVDHNPGYLLIKNIDIHEGYHIFDYRPEDIDDIVRVSFDDISTTLNANFETEIDNIFKYIDDRTHQETDFIENLRSSILQQYHHIRNDSR